MNFRCMTAQRRLNAGNASLPVQSGTSLYHTPHSQPASAGRTRGQPAACTVRVIKLLQKTWSQQKAMSMGPASLAKYPALSSMPCCSKFKRMPLSNFGAGKLAPHKVTVLDTQSRASVRQVRLTGGRVQQIFMPKSCILPPSRRRCAQGSRLSRTAPTAASHPATCSRRDLSAYQTFYGDQMHMSCPLSCM